MAILYHTRPSKSSKNLSRIMHEHAHARENTFFRRGLVTRTFFVQIRHFSHNVQNASFLIVNFIYLKTNKLPTRHALSLVFFVTFRAPLLTAQRKVNFIYHATEKPGGSAMVFFAQFQPSFSVHSAQFSKRIFYTPHVPTKPFF